ncbi:Sodium/hydrogen exchanger family-domain-containing protein, partial [Baffinella frigidus]
MEGVAGEHTAMLKAVASEAGMRRGGVAVDDTFVNGQWPVTAVASEAGMRRGGVAVADTFVNGQWPVTVVSVIFHFTKQSNIIACILVGAWHLRREAADTFIELGIIFLLFLGGLEVDVKAILSQYKLVLINGLGQIVITLAIFCSIGYASGLTTSVSLEGYPPPPVFVVTFFFGLACTLSSTILVLGCLKKRGEMERPHGQIILGLMVFQ